VTQWITNHLRPIFASQTGERGAEASFKNSAGHSALEVRHGAFGTWLASIDAPPFGVDFVRDLTLKAGGYNENKCSGRGERDSPATNDLPYTMRLAEPPEPFELVRSA